MSDSPLVQPATGGRQARLLGGGNYSVVITDTGAGFSRWRDQTITRWREDPTCDPWGSFIFLRDLSNGALWAPTQQPLSDATVRRTRVLDDKYAAFSGESDGVTATLSVAVVNALDAELRRVHLHNTSDRAREIEVTSFSELVLGPAPADASHPAFAKLFLQTHWDADGQLLLASRRKRSGDEADLWAGHRIVATGTSGVSIGSAPQYETDRARFLGRGNRLASADALQPGTALSNTVGTVLDSIFSLRPRIRLEAGASAQVDFWTLAAATREDVVRTAASLTTQSGDACLPPTFSAPNGDQLPRAPTSDDAAAPWLRWLAPLLYADSAWRAAPDALSLGSGGSPVLWAHGISGDRPIVLLRIADIDGCRAAETLLQAQRLWRQRWLGVDVVLLVTASGSEGKLVEQNLGSVQEKQASDSNNGDEAKAEIFVLREDQLDRAFLDGLTLAARVVLISEGSNPIPIAVRPHGSNPALIDVPDASTGSVSKSPPARPTAALAAWPGSSDDALEFGNGIGGFAAAGRDYRIDLEDGRSTPAPWINVVANPDFGFIVSAQGGGYTWSGNSQQNPLTPWPNDPVTDAANEIVYLRDEDSGDLWSATPAPIRVDGTHHRITHGKGWTRFSHRAHNIDVDLLQYVPVADSIKLSRLRLHNRSEVTRRLAVTGYVGWALAPNGSVAAPYVVTEHDPSTGAVFARNTWRAEFTERVAFFDLSGAQTSYSGDRLDFLGPCGTIEKPQALSRDSLSRRVGAGLDPCGALQTQVILAPGEEIELQFLLGDAPSSKDAQELIRRYRQADLDSVLAEVRQYWSDVLDTVQVKTPDRALDILLNDWLLYQSLGCRVWARSAYYQSSGAYGFRDQLQDVMSLCVTQPVIAREHIVRSAGRQFPEGDVQHWWLPPKGQGIRTRMSDDRLWLPYVAAHYINTSGDASVLEESVPFLAGPLLEAGKNEAFFTPATSDEASSVYEHGARAIDVSLALGAHDLPLIGTGDWNDGMNSVGDQGRGESVWLAWLLLATIDVYAKFGEQRGDDERVARWRAHAARLRVTVEKTGWDGQWYCRGYYDDGTPLGSVQSEECRIDTIAQSWSAMADATDRAHVTQAMASVTEHLLLKDEGIALLFTPPFDDGPTDPGYIKGYPPGVRENGGQYTHGAIWSVFAFSELGQGNEAGELFSMLNPINHSDSPEKLARYRVEPYVACADVYSVAPHVGRGGWTWYTGSAGWLYRAGLEALLGFHVEGASLRMSPCIPAAWPGFSLVYRYGASRYEVDVVNPGKVQCEIASSRLDDCIVQGDPGRIELIDDGQVHRWSLCMGTLQ